MDAEYASLIAGTIGDARPGCALGTLTRRGGSAEGAYVTCQLAVTRELRRTGVPYKP